MIERLIGLFLLLILIIIIAKQIFYKFNIRKYWIIFGASHFVLMGIIFFLIFSASEDVEWHFFLILPMIIDLPISIVCFLASFRSLTILMILMMVLGSLQYAFLGWLVDLLVEKSKKFGFHFKPIKTPIRRSVVSVMIILMIGFIHLFFTDTGSGLMGMFYVWMKGDPPVPAKNEVVMPPEATIKAVTKTGTIVIKSGKGLKRYYTWEGATRSVIMWPREQRWFGSLGLYYPGPGFHWIEHNGVKRGVLDEGQQHFNSIDEAEAWFKLPYHSDCTYRDDGLVVCFSKNLNRYQLNVEVWQIYIEGKTESQYRESADDRIWIPEESKPGIFKGSKYKIYYVGGHKPAKLNGSNNEAIHASWDNQ